MNAGAQASGDPAAMPPQEQQLQQQQQAPPDSQQPQVQQQSQAAAGTAVAGQQPQQPPGAAQPQVPQPHTALEGIVIPPQVVPQVVPYGSLGPDARMAATGEPPDVPPTTPQHERGLLFKGEVGGGRGGVKYVNREI